MTIKPGTLVSDIRTPRRTAFTPANIIISTAMILLPLLSTSDAWAFKRTEVREPCKNYNPLRQPFFGETHLHTGLSFDASIRFVQPSPRDAYNFAKGGSVVGVGPNGFATRTYTQDRPLDFAAVTDHSEHFGEMGVCKSAHLPGRFSFECQLINGFGGNRACSPVAGNAIWPPVRSIYWPCQTMAPASSTPACRCASMAKPTVSPVNSASGMKCRRPPRKLMTAARNARSPASLPMK